MHLVINDDMFAFLLEFIEVLFQEVGKVASLETQRFLDDVADEDESSVEAALDHLQVREESGEICKQSKKLFRLPFIILFDFISVAILVDLKKIMMKLKIFYHKKYLE
jgi:hypothetical protein